MLPLTVLAGVAVRLSLGLFNVRGGFVVPALVLLTGLDIRRAAATSLPAIALVSACGIASHLFAGRPVPGETALPFAAGGVAGLAVGTAAVKRLSPVALQTGFSVVIAIVAVYAAARSLS